MGEDSYMGGVFGSFHHELSSQVPAVDRNIGPAQSMNAPFCGNPTDLRVIDYAHPGSASLIQE